MVFKRKKYDYDLIVIGSGSGGSVAAYYARALGKKVAVFEAGAVGGECPNSACVPTKALLHSGKIYQTVLNAKKYGVNVENVTLNPHGVHAYKNLVVSRTSASHGEESFKKEGIDLIKQKAIFVSPHQ